MLLKIHDNYFKYNPEEDKFIAYGKSSNNPYSIGSWFTCSDSTILMLQKAVLQNNYRIVHNIPGMCKKY